MSVRDYDVVFVGAGLSALLLLAELRPQLPGRVAVIDPVPPSERGLVHWSYWSHERTPYDRFAIGTWRQAEVAGIAPQPIAPYTMRLVRSTDVLAHLGALLEDVPLDWLRTTARSISRRNDKLYEISTDAGAVRASWVFDSATEVSPTFPSSLRPRAVLGGTGLVVEADRAVFDTRTATLFDPLDERSFAYLLPLGPSAALLESASFGSVVADGDRAPLLHYLGARYPEARFAVTHEETGTIPLGFAPSSTSGPRHILIGAKRGLVKPSAGYGVVRIARESKHLARLWREDRELPASRPVSWQWRLLDTAFLRLAVRDPRRPMALLHRTMHAIPLAQTLRFIDEELPSRRVASLLSSTLPVVLRRP
jgi:lycopene beta-cyclase